MAFQSGPFEAALAAAAGDDGALHGELRAGFLEGAERQLDLMHRARCDAHWPGSDGTAAAAPAHTAGDRRSLREPA